MLAIAIILGVGVFGQIVIKKGDYNLPSAAALVVSLFALNTPLAIVVLSLLSVILLYVIVTYKK
jgi:membrane protein implicated in regulation of membrane protease activity